MSRCREPKDCALLREDYLECLHHSKEELLTRHKSTVAKFLSKKYDWFFSKYNSKLLKSSNYITRRLAIKLLGDMLLDRSNAIVMTRYVSSCDNLRILMNLLLESSKSIQTAAFYVFKEFYIRHADGFPISSEAERDRVIQCLEAAIARRASKGLELVVCTDDRVGLLSDITRMFREYDLTIQWAEVSTKSGKAQDTFYVTDVEGNHVDQRTIDSIVQQVGPNVLHVKQDLDMQPKPHHETAIGFFLGNFFRYCR